jgi:hypothetical protein
MVRLAVCFQRRRCVNDLFQAVQSEVQNHHKQGGISLGIISFNQIGSKHRVGRGKGEGEGEGEGRGEEGGRMPECTG